MALLPEGGLQKRKSRKYKTYHVMKYRHQCNIETWMFFSLVHLDFKLTKCKNPNKTLQAKLKTRISSDIDNHHK